MAKEKLVGYFGKFTKVDLGSDITSGSTLEEGELYLVKQIDDSASALPSGVEVGYTFMADGTETLATDDVVQKMTQTDLCDLTKWGLEFSSDEIDVTTLCDDSKKYIAGMVDITGSSEGIYAIGTTDQPGGFANAFVDIVDQAGKGGTVSVSKIDNQPLVALLYKQKSDSVDETVEFYVAPITITSFSDGVSGSDAQSFSSAFRIAPSNDIKLSLVKIKMS